MQNKVVKFETHQGYINFIENTSDSARTIFLRTLTVQGFDNYFSDPNNINFSDTTSKFKMDEFLGQILNDKGIVQIENYLFKVSLLDSSVYVLPYDDTKDNYNDVVAKFTSSKDRLKFSTDDDVIDIVFSSGTPKCGGSSDFSISTPYFYDETGIFGLMGGEYIFFSVKYFKGGIYYSVRVRGHQNPNQFGQYGTTPNLQFEIKADTPSSKSMRMRPRPCSGSNNVFHHGGLRNFDGGGVFSNDFFGRYQTWKGYERARGLNGYRIWIRGYINGVPSSSQWIGREVNSNF